ncbi:hypothetical protein PSPO01_15778 [Paraphaeosphaeria sporulosa]
MSDVKYASGAVLAVTEKAEGQYSVEQLEIQSSTRSKVPAGIDAVIPIHWSIGPISVDGYINTDTFEIRITVNIAGISVGTFVGNLKDGVSVNVNLFVATGELKFYLKNGNELWIHYSIKIRFDGSFEGDKEILSF